MSYPNPILGHIFIAPDTISYRNLYEILSGGHFNIGHYYVLHKVCGIFHTLHFKDELCT